MFTLNRMDFTTAPKPYRMGLLFTQQEWRIHTFSWRGGGGGRQPEPVKRGGAVLRNNFVWPLGPQFGLKIRRGEGP